MQCAPQNHIFALRTPLLFYVYVRKNHQSEKSDKIVFEELTWKKGEKNDIKVSFYIYVVYSGRWQNYKMSLTKVFSQDVGLL